MKKFNLRKKASVEDFTISDKGLDKNRKDMNLSNDQQGVVNKNINLSLPTKGKDNTVPFNVQLEASRKNKTTVAITEADMDDKIVDFKSTDKKQVMDINVESRKYMDEHSDAYKKAEKASKADTEFWDKYVGDQLEGTMKNISNNMPESTSQLQNIPNRFKGEKIDKMVMASMKDADAMLFHIYAKASQENRGLTDEEQQQIVDINSGKIRLAQQFQPVDPVKRCLEPGGGITFRNNGRGVSVMENGNPIDEFSDCREAKANYPEGENENEQLV
jgi:hypothetical protein